METKNILNSEKQLKTLLPNKLTGYIWMVECEEPIFYNEEQLKIETLAYRKNPYNKIQEAYLYDNTNEQSIHIKNIDGKELYFIHHEDHFKDNNFKISNKTLKFPSHKNNKNLKFKQVYQLTESISTGEFKTWQPIVRLFKGFTN